MKKKLVGLNIFVIAVAIVYALILGVGNVQTVKSSVAVIPGTYGEQFANEKHLHTVQLADSQKAYFDQRYELFEYNMNDGEIVLKQYNGQSTDLVIPATIDGKRVTTLSEGFIDSLTSVKNLYVSDSMKDIQGEPNAAIKVCCLEDNAFYLEHKDSGWTFETVYDSTFVNFNLGSIPFEYNLNGNNIEITRYSGEKADVVVIPSYINGYAVTNVSMDLLCAAKVIVIPETVISITGTASKTLFSPVFAVELVFTLLAIIIALVMIDVIVPRYAKDNREYLLSGNQMVAIVLYVIVQVTFSITTIYYIMIPAYLAFIISLVFLVAFIAGIYLGGMGRKHVERIENHIEEKTSRMKAIKLSARNLSAEIHEQETRKIVQRLEEEIRFSDPVSCADLDMIETEMEQGVEALKKTISGGDIQLIRNSADELLKLVQERNKLCKAGK